MSTQTTQIHTEVVLELDGRRLVGGRPEDFLIDPTRGSHCFYEGNLYEVTDSIQTVGAPMSKVGSVLAELLNILYTNPTQAQTLLAGMQRVSEPMTPAPIATTGTDSSGIVSTGLGIIALAQKERLLFLRLKMVHRAQQNIWQQLAAGDASAVRIHPTGEPATTKTAE